MTRAMSARHPTPQASPRRKPEPSASTRWIPAFAGMTMLLAACGDAGIAVKPQVLTPPPSAPRTVFFVEKPDVQSREVGNEAWQRNAAYGELLADHLRRALQERDKTLTSPPADIVRSKVYLAYGKAPVKVADSRRAKTYVEVQLRLIDAATGRVLYSTHTLTPIEDPLLGWGPEIDEVIREVLRHASADFASRL
jgi:hypothetical protein